MTTNSSSISNILTTNLTTSSSSYQNPSTTTNHSRYHNLTTISNILHTYNTSNNSSHQMHSSHQLSFLDVFVVCIYILIFIIGVSGNLLVCRYFKLDNKRIKHLQLLIFYLGIADLCASITNPVLFIYFQLTHYKAWHFGVIGCKLVPMTWRMFTSISFGIIMYINIDRCLALKFPFRKPPTKRQVNIVVGLICIVSVLMETPYLVYADVKRNKHEVTCNVPQVSTTGYAYPRLSIIITRDLLYIAVFITSFVIIKAELADADKESGRGRIARVSQIARHQENKRVLKMLLAVAAGFVVSVFPRELLHIVYTISWLGPSGDGIRQTTALNHINTLLTSLMCCNTICNVIIYAKLHRKFRFIVFSTVFSVSAMYRDGNSNCGCGNHTTSNGNGRHNKRNNLRLKEELLNVDGETTANNDGE